MKVDQVFFPTEAVRIDGQRQFSNSVYYQLFQSCWPLSVKLAQLASNHSTDKFLWNYVSMFPRMLFLVMFRVFFSSAEYLRSS